MCAPARPPALLPLEGDLAVQQARKLPATRSIISLARVVPMINEMNRRRFPSNALSPVLLLQFLHVSPKIGQWDSVVGIAWWAMHEWDGHASVACTKCTGTTRREIRSIWYLRDTENRWQGSARHFRSSYGCRKYITRSYCSWCWGVTEAEVATGGGQIR